MRKRLLSILVISLFPCACAAPTPLPTATVPATLITPEPMPAATETTMVAPDGWSTFANDELGFVLAYPATAVLVQGEAPTLAIVNFPIDQATNVVEEVLTLSGVLGAGTCSSPLAEGWAAGELAPETVVLNSVTFLRQTHSGVAAGTASTWVAYTTERDGRCVSLTYELRTFDPANLDPTRFPTPPATIDWQARVRDFEMIVATFTWIR